MAQSAFKLERFEENYSTFSPEVGDWDPYSRMKKIDLGTDSYVSLGGEIRERADSFDAPAFGIGNRSDSYDLQRILLHADLHVGSRTRVFVQLGQHSAFGKDQTNLTDRDGVEFQNAFLDFTPDADRNLTIRLGRQDIILNPVQRFIAVREGPNVRQSFDGLSGAWRRSDVRVKAFATRPVRYEPGAFDDSSDRSQRFFGTDVTYAPEGADTLELYALELDRDRVRFGGVQADERRRTLAFRWNGTQDSVDHDVETLYQGGTFGSSQIRAWAIAASAGYTFSRPGEPRLGLEFDGGSGDRNAKDGRLQTFNPMFPKGPFFDPSSLSSWANLELLRLSASVTPTPSLAVSFAAGERWRQSVADAVYVEPYIPLAPTLGNRERRVGEQYEFNLTWQMNRHVVVTAQALHATAGPALRRAGGRTADFGMAMVQFRF